MEDRQTTKIFKTLKSVSVLDTFSSASGTKSSKFEKVMIVQTHAHDEENGRFFFFFFQKKAVIQCKLLLLEK